MTKLLWRISLKLSLWSDELIDCDRNHTIRMPRFNNSATPRSPSHSAIKVKKKITHRPRFYPHQYHHCPPLPPLPWPPQSTPDNHHHHQHFFCFFFLDLGLFVVSLNDSAVCNVILACCSFFVLRTMRVRNMKVCDCDIDAGDGC